MITKNIELVPFRVPSYVIQKTPARPRQDGFKEAPKYHLSELDEDTLIALCDQFKADVLAKAKAGPTVSSEDNDHAT